jgi:hypothetical protein
VVGGNPWKPAEIHRIELYSAHIEELYLAISRDLVRDWDLPTPQAPQICRGTRWLISACSASSKAEGFMRLPIRNGKTAGLYDGF